MNQKEKLKRKRRNWYQTKYEIAAFIVDRLTNYKEKYNQFGHALPDWILECSDKKVAYTKQEELSLRAWYNKELKK